MQNGGKGGSDTAFPFFLFPLLLAVAAFSAPPGISQAYPLATLRLAVFSATAHALWAAVRDPVGTPSPILLAAGFALLCIGHAFSSVYVWVSLQHAVNVTMAVALLAAAYFRFRTDPETCWKRLSGALFWVAAAVLLLAMGQRILEGTPRPAASFGNANYLSEFLASASLLAGTRLLWGEGESPRARAAIGLACAGFAAGCLLLGQSRGVMIGLGLAVPLLLAIRFGLRRGVFRSALLLVPVLLLAGIPALQRFGFADVYNYSRITIWKAALETFLRNPFGVGLGGFKYYWPRFQEPISGVFGRYAKTADTAHNEYLEVLSGLGLIGFLLFLAVLAFPAARIAASMGALDDRRKPIAAGASACLLLSAVNALFNANFHEPGIVVLDSLLLAAALSALPREASAGWTLPVRPLRAAVAIPAALLLVSLSTVSAAALFQYGEARSRAGDLAGAERAHTLAAAVDPLRAAYPDAVAAIRYRAYRAAPPPDRAEAEQALASVYRWEAKAVRLNPREASYYGRLAAISAEHALLAAPGKRDLGRALYLNRKALLLAPHAVERHWQKAELLSAAGRRGEAVEALKHAVGIEPNFCRGYDGISRLLRSEDPSASAAWADRAEECRANSRRFTLTPAERWMAGGEEAAGG